METILVNGAEIPPAAVAAEMQYHPAPSRQQAWTAAATALVIRQLLLQEAARLGIAADAHINAASGTIRNRPVWAKRVQHPK